MRSQGRAPQAMLKEPPTRSAALDTADNFAHSRDDHCDGVIAAHCNMQTSSMYASTDGCSPKLDMSHIATHSSFRRRKPETVFFCLNAETSTDVQHEPGYTSRGRLPMRDVVRRGIDAGEAISRRSPLRRSFLVPSSVSSPRQLVERLL